MKNLKHEQMKIVGLGLILCLLIFSCHSKNDTNAEGLSQSDIENMEETSQMNSDEINYEGTFKGKIKGKEVELKLDGDKFEITENGKRAFGSWAKLDDGTSIELIPSSGSTITKFYGYSDNDTWVALNSDGTYPTAENEEFLKRIPD